MIRVGKRPHHRRCWLRGFDSCLSPRRAAFCNHRDSETAEEASAFWGWGWANLEGSIHLPSFSHLWMGVGICTAAYDWSKQRSGESERDEWMSECVERHLDAQTTSSQTWMQLKTPSLQLRGWVLPIAHHSGHHSVHSRIWRHWDSVCNLVIRPRARRSHLSSGVVWFGSSHKAAVGKQCPSPGGIWHPKSLWACLPYLWNEKEVCLCAQLICNKKHV